MKKLFFYLLFLGFIMPVSAGDGNVKELFEQFLSTDWPTVIAAKEDIENLGDQGIPGLIELLNNAQILKLKNTGDLIYPGAERFFGHGQIIDYDIDVACIRAGWLLEELTFKNFGFTGFHLPAEELNDFLKKTFTEYFSTGENLSQIETMNETEKRELIKKLSIERAHSWWSIASGKWSRLGALEEALNGTDEKCQVKALFYMRNGKTVCTGLDQKEYKARLSKTIERLAKSTTSRVSENAKLIMLDNDYSWLAIKPVH
jgi:hypothetical protein